MMSETPQLQSVAARVLVLTHEIKFNQISMMASVISVIHVNVRENMLFYVNTDRVNKL